MSLLLASASSTVQAGFLLFILIAGYVVLWAIWHFFFRGAGEDSDRSDS